MAINPTLLTTEHYCISIYTIPTPLSAWRPCWSYFSLRNCQSLWLLFPTNPAHIVSRWLPALLVKPSLPGIPPCDTMHFHDHQGLWEEVLKLSAPQWPVAGAGERERLWIIRMLVGTSLPPQECSWQVTTSHWANQGKSQPHAIILGQLTHILCGRQPKKMSSRPQGLICGNCLEPSHFTPALILHFLLCSFAHLAQDLLGTVSYLWPSLIHPLGLPCSTFDSLSAL